MTHAWSKSALMSPTLVAATATMMKVPNFQDPYQATLSLVTTQLGMSFTMEGETEKRVPGKCRLIETFQSAGEWNLERDVAPPICCPGLFGRLTCGNLPGLGTLSSRTAEFEI